MGHARRKADAAACDHLTLGNRSLMNAPAKIQIDSSLSALAKAHQELLAIFEDGTSKRGRQEDRAVESTSQNKRTASKSARKGE